MTTSKTDSQVLFSVVYELDGVRADADYALRVVGQGRSGGGLDEVDCHEVASLLRQVLGRLDGITAAITAQLSQEEPRARS